MNKIKVYYLDVEHAKAPEIVEIDNETNDDLYRLLNCSCIDVTRRSFGGKEFLVIVDDVGALKKDRKLSVYGFNVYDRLFGNIIIANKRGNDLDSISDIDLIRLNSRVCRYVTDKAYNVLMVDGLKTFYKATTEVNNEKRHQEKINNNG